jgi:hypothetical protein
MLEAVDFAALRVDASQDVADRAVLSGGVHGLKNKEHRISVGSIEEALQSTQFLDVRGEKLLVMAFRLIERRYAGCPFLKPDSLSARGAEVFEVEFRYVFHIERSAQAANSREPRLLRVFAISAKVLLAARRAKRIVFGVAFWSRSFP